jgi:hypothetical protein
MKPHTFMEDCSVYRGSSRYTVELNEIGMPEAKVKQAGKDDSLTGAMSIAQRPPAIPAKYSTSGI